MRRPVSRVEIDDTHAKECGIADSTTKKLPALLGAGGRGKKKKKYNKKKPPRININKDLYTEAAIACETHERTGIDRQPAGDPRYAPRQGSLVHDGPSRIAPPFALLSQQISLARLVGDEVGGVSAHRKMRQAFNDGGIRRRRTRRDTGRGGKLFSVKSH